MDETRYLRLMFSPHSCASAILVPLICLTKILDTVHQPRFLEFWIDRRYDSKLRELTRVGLLKWRVRKTEIQRGDECLLTQVVRRTRALLPDGMHDGLLWTLKRETYASFWTWRSKWISKCCSFHISFQRCIYLNYFAY